MSTPLDDVALDDMFRACLEAGRSLGAAQVMMMDGSPNGALMLVSVLNFAERLTRTDPGIAAMIREQAHKLMHEQAENATAVESTAVEIEAPACPRCGRRTGNITAPHLAGDGDGIAWCMNEADEAAFLERHPDSIVVQACAVCGFAQTCGEPPGEDCHS